MVPKRNRFFLGMIHADRSWALQLEKGCELYKLHERYSLNPMFEIGLYGQHEERLPKDNKM
ncbi:hypothetical protein JCM19037_4250 [Geomicrobium sp. JCM 19037]|nr:hypothetical protein JCM19037_4250 [Geomicrobium sp. JCM 19037]